MRSLERLTLTLMLLTSLTWAAWGCDSKGPRETPEGTILALKETVLEGRADRLGDFVYAEGPEMRRLLRRTGVMLGNVQELAGSIQTKFPDEVAALKAQALEAAKEGNSSGFLSQMMGQMGGQAAGRGGRRRARQDPSKTRASFDAFLKGLMADPYGWAAEADTRLTTAFVTDDTVALLWDEKPVMAPLGLTMRKAEDGRWYLQLPSFPGVTSVMPRTPEQYKIFGSLIATFDNLIIDLRKDVESGGVRDLNGLSTKAGEKAFLPVAAAFFAYGNYTAQIQREARKAAESAAAEKPK